MSDNKMTVGGPIESRCTKCRKITNHIIVAITDGLPDKVECNTCKGQHKYRAPAARKKATVRRTVDPRIVEQKEWEELRTEIESKKDVPYSMDVTFKVGTVIRHPVFGLGLVQNKIGPQKVGVLFADGKKKMRCL